MAVRIQRKRTKGWRMPKDAVYVGRPTIWGNRFTMDDGLTRQECVDRFREMVNRGGWWAVNPQRHSRGKDLACWCRLGQPCHADVLLEIANS